MTHRPMLRPMRLLLRLVRVRDLALAERYFRGVPAGSVIPTPLFGHTLPLDVSRSTTHRLLCLQQERFIAERGLVGALARPGDCVVDVGANIGYYLLLFQSRVGAAGRVVCVEPEPTNLGELRRCIAANGFSNVELLAAAAGAARGEVVLREGLNGRVETGGGEGRTVPMIPLDSLCDRRPALVKIDIEGFEGQALAGMAQMLGTLAPALFVEVHPRLLNYGYAVRDVVGLAQPHYARVEFWEPADQGSLIQRLRARYCSSRAVRRIVDEAALLADCDTGRRTDPFWMICRRA